MLLAVIHSNLSGKLLALSEVGEGAGELFLGIQVEVGKKPIAGKTET